MRGVSRVWALPLRVSLCVVAFGGCDLGREGELDGGPSLQANAPSGPTEGLEIEYNPVSGAPWAKTSLPIQPDLPAGEPKDPIEPSAGMQIGTWQDHVRLELPPGPSGAAPSLTVIANHRVRDGVLGTGHQLSGTSVITRRSNSGGVPGYGEDDAYFLDGLRLYQRGDGLWVPEIDDGSELAFDPATNSWTLWRRGSEAVYGGGVEHLLLLYDRHGRIVDQEPQIPLNFDDPEERTCALSLAPVPLCNTAAWYIASSADPRGNAVSYGYTKPNVPAALEAIYWYESVRRPLLTSLTWANGEARAELDYGPRPDPRLDVSPGTPTLLAHRLVEVRSYGRGDALFSRYAFSYKDEGGEPCPTANEEPPLPADAGRTEQRPIQTLLQRITRTDDGSPALERTVRCLQTHDEPVTWSGGVDLSADIALPDADATWSYNERSLVPVAANLSGDGRQDLVLLGVRCGSNGGCAVDHTAYSSLAPATQGGPPRFRRLSTWTEALNTRLNGTHFELKLGYAFVDLDGDGISELVWTQAVDSGSMHTYTARVLRHYYQQKGFLADPADTGSDTILDLASPREDLQGGVFADVDGDGLVDLTVPTSHVWYRNAGRIPFFSVDRQYPLALPHDDPAVLDLDSSVLEPPLGMSPEDLRRSGTRLADFNGDGLVDVAYALYTRWELVNSDYYAPDDSSLVSRIFYGDGYGAFFDSGLSAGAPTMLQVPGAGTAASPVRLHHGMLAAMDLDRSGYPELLNAADWVSGPVPDIPVGGAYDRGLVLGYDLVPSTPAGYPGGRSTQWDHAADIDVPLALSGGAHQACAEHLVVPAFGDFDGGGFPDLVTFEYHTDAATSSCGTEGWCVAYRNNQRTAAQGRLMTSDNAWGGRTTLEWSYTADKFAEHDTTNLPQNLEVLAAVEGGEGRTVMRYGRGALSLGRFRGFGLVDRIDELLGVERFGFATSPALAGAPLYKVRLDATHDGFERATVYAYGQRTDTGYQLDAAAPYWNPRLRTCEYTATPGRIKSIKALIRSCWGFDLPGEQIPSNAVLAAATGTWRFPTYQLTESGSSAYEVAVRLWQDDIKKVWAAEHVPLSNLEQSVPRYGQWSFHKEVPSGEPKVFHPWTAYLDHPLVPAPLSAADLAADVPDAAKISGWSAYVVDWRYDPQTHQVVEVVRHRDVTTPDDDQRTGLTHQDCGPGGAWCLTSAVTTDGAGARLSSMERRDFDPAGVDDAQTVERCGVDPAECVVTTQRWHPNGAEAERVEDAGGPDERRWTWDYSGWCGTLTATDPEGRERVTTYDGGCRVATETWLGTTTEIAYDGLGRMVRRTVDPGTGADPRVETWAHVDTLAVGPEALQTGVPRAVHATAGRMDTQMVDGFGRTRGSVLCALAEDATAEAPDCGGELLRGPAVYLDALGRETLLATAYLGTWEQDSPDFTLRTWDHAGRLVAVKEPAHTRETPMRLTRHWYLPDRVVTLDAAGRTIVELSTTLLDETTVEGVLAERRERDAFGRVVRSYEREDGFTLRQAYDGFGRVARIWREEVAPCVDAGDQLVDKCEWATRMSYDNLGRLTRRTQPDGSALGWTYDGLDRPLSETHYAPAAGGFDKDGPATGVLRSWNYELDLDAGLQIEQLTLETGAVERTERDGLGRVVEEVSPLGILRVYDWGVEPGPNSVTTMEVWPFTVLQYELTTAFEYDAYGRIEAIVRPEGATVMTRDAEGRVLTATDPDDVVTRYAYTPGGLLEREERGPWLLGLRAYDALGRVFGELSGGVATERVYDELGRLVERRMGVDEDGSPERTWTVLEFDGDSDRPARVAVWPVAEAKAESTVDYDAWGRVTQITDPEGREQRQELDVAGRVRRTIDGEGYARVRAYDTRGRLAYHEANGQDWLKITRTEGLDYQAALPGSPLWLNLTRTTLTDPRGVARERWTDSAGRLVASIRADGSRLERSYDGSRLRSEWDIGADGQLLLETQHHYDAFGRLETTVGPAQLGVLDPVQYTVTRELSPGGRVAALVMGGERTELDYDDEGLLVEERFRGLRRELLRPEVDDETPLSARYPWIEGERLYPANDTLAVRDKHVERDAAGRPTRLEFNAPGVAAVVRTFEDYDYYGRPAREEADGIVHVWSYDGAGLPAARATSVDGADVGETRWFWHDNGVLKAVRGPFGKRTRYDYGEPFDFELDEVRAGDGTVYASGFEYDERGRMTAVELAGGERREQLFDDSGRPYWVGVRQGGALVTERTLHYDGLGRLFRKEIATVDPAFAPGWADVYSYDGAGRLVGEVREFQGGGKWARAYVLDEAGNRLQTLDGQGAVLTELGYTAPGILKDVDGVPVGFDSWRGVVEDHRGTTYKRAADGRIAEVSAGAATYAIRRDAHGLPVVIDDGADGQDTRVTAWGLNPAGLPVEARAADGSWTTWVSAEGMLLTRLNGGGALGDESVLTDQVGSVLTVDDVPSEPASAFGAGGSEVLGEVRLDYAKMESLPGIPGVHLARHRAYDAELGRFLSLDPLGLEGGHNRTLYAEGNPVALMDPLGLSACPEAQTGSNDFQVDAGLRRFEVQTSGAPPLRPTFDRTIDATAFSFRTEFYRRNSKRGTITCFTTQCDGGLEPLGAKGSKKRGSDTTDAGDSAGSSQDTKDRQAKREEDRAIAKVARHDRRQEGREKRATRAAQRCLASGKGCGQARRLAARIARSDLRLRKSLTRRGIEDVETFIDIWSTRDSGGDTAVPSGATTTVPTQAGSPPAGWNEPADLIEYEGDLEITAERPGPRGTVEMVESTNGGDEDTQVVTPHETKDNKALQGLVDTLGEAVVQDIIKVGGGLISGIVGAFIKPKADEASNLATAGAQALVGTYSAVAEQQHERQMDRWIDRENNRELLEQLPALRQEAARLYAEDPDQPVYLRTHRSRMRISSHGMNAGKEGGLTNHAGDADYSVTRDTSGPRSWTRQMRAPGSRATFHHTVHYRLMERPKGQAPVSASGLAPTY